MRLALAPLVFVACNAGDGGATDLSSSDLAPAADLSPADACQANFADDPANCGRCGHECLGGECLGGRCAPMQLAGAQDGAWGIAIDDQSVYFTINSGPGALRSVSKAGGMVTTIFDESGACLSVAVDGDTVFWGADGAVRSAPRTGVPAGSSPQTLATGVVGPFGIAAAAGWIYFTNNGTAAPGFNDGEVRRVPVGGGMVTTLVAGEVGGGPYGLVVDATSVYWTSHESMVRKAPLAGGQQPTVLSAMAGAEGIALDAQAVYFADFAAGTVSAIGLDGANPRVLASNLGFARGVAVDDAHVYFTTLDRVARVAKQGGQVEVLASGQSAAEFVAVDAAAVYWTNTGNAPSTGQVMKVALP